MLAARSASRLSIAGHRLSWHLGQVAVEPLPTLTQRLLVSDNDPQRVERDIASRGTRTHKQVVHDRQLNLACNLQRRLQKTVQRLAHHALSRVFDGHYAIVTKPRFDLTKNIVDARLALGHSRLTKMLHRSRLRVSTFRAQKRHRKRLLQRQASGHQLSKDRRYLIPRQGPRVALLNRPQDLRLPLRPVKQRPHLVRL